MQRCVSTHMYMKKVEIKLVVKVGRKGCCRMKNIWEEILNEQMSSCY